jgi:probable rRNA maturation factor
MALVNYFSEDINFDIPNPRKTARWIKGAVIRERKSLKEINYIFCSDEYLLKINQFYLNHSTLTDIVTFDSSEKSCLAGDIFISIPRVIENAKKFEVSLKDELHRVMIHGVLHLMGYSDKSKAEKTKMRKKEDAYLSLR